MVFLLRLVGIDPWQSISESRASKKKILQINNLQIKRAKRSATSPEPVKKLDKDHLSQF